MRACSFPGCGRPVYCRGYCNSHDKQLRRSGVLKPIRPMRKYHLDLAGVVKHILSRTEKRGDCLIWQGALGTDGYGRIGFQGKTVIVHRLVLEHFVGPCPDGMESCHAVECEHLACVNPRHLRWDTSTENNLDSARRGIGNRRFTPDQVRRARTMLADGATLRAVSEEMGGVSLSAVHSLKHGRTYGWVE